MTLSTANRKNKTNGTLQKKTCPIFMLNPFSSSVTCTEQSSELYKLLAQQENLLVLGYQMGYYSGIKLSVNLQ